MDVSEARRTANRLNSLKSTGPKTDRGKEVSRRNSLKHGLSGEGVVVVEADLGEIQQRAESLANDLKPTSMAGSILIDRMATLSVRADRAAEQELAAIRMNVRHAVDDFDEERLDRADDLFDALALGEDPRKNLRKLRKMPEGVERLIESWQDLRAVLTQPSVMAWTVDHLGRAALLLGMNEVQARGSWVGTLSRAVWGDFQDLEPAKGLEHGAEVRRAWSRNQMVERIDAEIASLEAHYETLDFETIHLDREEAPERALFDASKPATLARRYQSEAERGFFKALKEFRQVEAENLAQAEAAPTPPPAPRMASFRETPPPPRREPARTFPEAPETPFSTATDRNGQPLSIGQPPRTTG